MTTLNTLEYERTPWQPCIDEGWQQLQVKRRFAVELGKMLQNEPTSAADREVPYLKSQHVQWEDVRLGDLPTMWASPSEIAFLHVSPGDLLVCEGGDVGRAAIMQTEPPEDCIIQNALHRVRGCGAGDVRFLRYALMQAAEQNWFDVLCNRSTIAHFTVDKFREMWVWVPSLEEQRAIADYLDRETARIDALVAAKERALGLLAEKRRALITRAVTQGLNPDAPMRNSGVSWLGDVPAYWAVPPVYARFEVLLGKMLDEKQIRGTHLAPYLRNIDVQWERINTKDLPMMDFDEEDRKRLSLRPGDLLVCEGGEVGRTAMWQGEIENCFYQKALHRLRPTSEKDDPAFFVQVMLTMAHIGVFSSQSSASTIQHLPAEKLRVVRYPAPPREEQCAIVAYIKAETQKLDALQKMTKRTVELLTERRAALIAEAVTGRLAVGGLA